MGEAIEKLGADIVIGIDADLQFDPPFALRIVNRFPWLQGMTARVIGLGVRPEHVHSAEAS